MQRPKLGLVLGVILAQLWLVCDAKQIPDVKPIHRGCMGSSWLKLPERGWR